MPEQFVPPIAHTLVIDGGRILIDGKDFPWVVGTDFEVEEIVANDDSEGPFNFVTLTLFVEHVEVRNLLDRSSVTVTKNLRYGHYRSGAIGQA